MLRSAMELRKLAIERAFEIARGGTCVGVSDLVRMLGKEGYDSRQIEGRHLKKQLSELIRQAKANLAPKPE